MTGLWRTELLGFALLFFVVPTIAYAAPQACSRTVLPLVDTHAQPPYPAISAFAEEEGITELSVVIDEQGNVSDAQVFKSSGSKYLDEAALSFVKDKWKWFPSATLCKTQTEVRWDLHRDITKPSSLYLITRLPRGRRRKRAFQA
jgi:TonB family protein